MKTRQERIEIVNRARARWKEHGTTGAYARSESGMRTEPTSSDAVCWCAIGALRKEVGGGEPAVREALGLSTRVGNALLMELLDANDRGLSDVDAVFDELIAAIPEFP